MRASTEELVVLAAFTIIYWTRYDGISEVFSHCLLVPPMLFIDDIRPRLGRIWVYASLAVMVSCDPMCAALQQYLDTEKYLNDAELWAKVACSAGGLFCLPVYFTLVRPPREQQRIPNFSWTFSKLVLSLPGGLELVFPQGSIVEAVVKTRACRMAVMAYCSYIVLVSCTIALAEYVYRSVDIFAAVTFLTYLTVLSVVSLAYCGPRFIWPGLNTRRSTFVLYLVVFPATVAATYGLQVNGIVEMDTILLGAKFIAFHLKLALNLIAPPASIRCMLMMWRRWRL